MRPSVHVPMGVYARLQAGEQHAHASREAEAIEQPKPAADFFGRARCAAHTSAKLRICCPRRRASPSETPNRDHGRVIRARKRVCDRPRRHLAPQPMLYRVGVKVQGELSLNHRDGPRPYLISRRRRARDFLVQKAFCSADEVCGQLGLVVRGRHRCQEHEVAGGDFK